MSDPTDDPVTPASSPDRPEPQAQPAEAPAATAVTPPVGVEVEEETPAGGHPEDAPAEPAAPPPAVETGRARAPKAPRAKKTRPPEVVETAPAPTPEPEPTPEPAAPEPAAATPTLVPLDDDEEEAPKLVWYVLKVQSSREDTIRDALERRVKIQGLQKFFGRIVVPTEKITEIRNNKKRVVERKTYPGYIMVEMELNEKTWFVVRETPGVGDFVGAHQKPTQMTETEVKQMLGQETAKTEEAPRVRIDVERGDRVKIKDGPFENFEGTVEEVIEARGLVKVMLIIFNRPTPVDLEYWQVERI